jgi:hypothetical protein
MTDFQNDKGIKKILKEAYEPVAPSSEFKEQLRERLSYEVAGAGMSTPVLARPKLVVPIIAGVAAGLIAYGVWLSVHFVPSLLP